jgi:hypothetical protein
MNDYIVHVSLKPEVHDTGPAQPNLSNMIILAKSVVERKVLGRSLGSFLHPAVTNLP